MTRLTILLKNIAMKIPTNIRISDTTITIPVTEINKLINYMLFIQTIHIE